MKDVMDLKTMREFINSLDGAAVLDAQGVYTYVSPGWEKFTGLTAEQALGKKVWDLVPDTHAREVFRTKKPVFAKVVRSHGVPAFTSYYPRLAADGSVEGLFLYIMFQGEDYARDLMERLNALTSKVEFYQQELSRERGAKYGLDNIIGESEAVRELKEEIIRAARSSSTVLIEGETGSGKELIAHAIHTLSPRNTGNFVRVNCSAIPAELLESEFFGYSAGAFTGASKRGKLGRFELANGGSIFLDEVNLLSTTMQPKFLRVLQEREIDPVGGLKSIPIDVRVIAASNIPLETLVESGQFRQDLYYRLNVISICAPPLRERMEDIPLLADHFIRRFNRELGMMVQGIEADALKLLQDYHWPGNIREMQNAIERAMNLTRGPFLRREDFLHLEQRVRAGERRELPGEMSYRLRPAKQAFEKEFIQAALAAAGGNRAKAARMLGISRTVLYDKLAGYHLD